MLLIVMSSPPIVKAPTTAPLLFATTPAFGKGTPEFTVPVSTGTPSPALKAFCSASLAIGEIKAPLLDATVNAPTLGRPAIVALPQAHLESSRYVGRLLV